MKRANAVSTMAAVIFVIGIALIAPPSVRGVEPEIIPAGLGCSFDVLWHPEHKGGPAAAHVPIGYGNISLTNLDTGVSIVTKSRYTSTETYDPVTNAVSGEVMGRIFFQFYPGDQGPAGMVGEPGALLRLAGNTRYTLDLDTFVFTAFSFHGEATDLCALLARP